MNHPQKIAARKRWKPLVDQWNKSGKSAKSWCRENKINYTGFIEWRKRILENSEGDAIKNQFIEIKDDASSDSGIEIRVNGMEIKLSSQFNTATLCTCLKVLKNLSC